MHSEHDKEIESFFTQLKEKDSEIQIPDFEEPFRQRSVNWWIPLGIAASLAIGFWYAKEMPKDTDLPADMIIITLENDANNNQQIMIEEKTYLEMWESPTSSLLTEY